MNQLVSLHCISLTECLATQLTHEIFDSCMKCTFGTCESSLKVSGTILSFVVVTQKISHRQKKADAQLHQLFLSKPFHYIHQKRNPRETDVGSKILVWEITTWALT